MAEQQEQQRQGGGLDKAHVVMAILILLTSIGLVAFVYFLFGVNGPRVMIIGGGIVLVILFGIWVVSAGVSIADSAKNNEAARNSQAKKDLTDIAETVAATVGDTIESVVGVLAEDNKVDQQIVKALLEAVKAQGQIGVQEAKADHGIRLMEYRQLMANQRQQEAAEQKQLAANMEEQQRMAQATKWLASAGGALKLPEIT